MEDKLKNQQDAPPGENMGATANLKTTEDAGEKPVTPKKTIAVDADILQKLLDKVDKQDEQLKDLTAAADVGRLQRIQELRNKGKLVKRAKVSIYEGKYVLGWSRVRDDVYFDESGKLHEDQTVELTLDSGEGVAPTKTEPMSYRQFARLITKEEGEVIKESKDEDGHMSFVVQMASGRKLELLIVFLN